MPPAARPTAPPHPTHLRIRVSITGSDPAIWRLLEVSTALRLDELHEVIQLAFDWRDVHLHQFSDLDPEERGIPRIGIPARVWAQETPFDDREEDELDERDATLGEIFGDPDAADAADAAPGSPGAAAPARPTRFDGPLFYEYDFGDGWVHTIELIERIDDADAPPALLVRGARRGPFEDSGGIAGYEDKLAALADPTRPDHAEIADWLTWTAGPWASVDPDAVDVENVNLALAARFGTGPGTAVTASAPGTAPDTAIGRLLTRLPATAARDLHGLLRRTGALEHEDPDAATAADMVEPYAWMLRAARDDGIRLTAAGRIRPATVKRAMTELGWLQPYHSRTFREDLIVPIARLHEDALQYGLLVKRGGALHVADDAAGLADDPLALWSRIAHALVLRAPGDADRDVAVLVAIEVATGLADRHRAALGYDAVGIGDGMDALGWALDDGTPLPEHAVTGTVYDVLETLGTLGALGDERTDVLLHGPTDAVPARGRAFARAVLQTPLP